jgi:hypothetical protein
MLGLGFGLDLGAGERDRTADLPFTRRPLCQLSYTGGDVLMVAETADRLPSSIPPSYQQHAKFMLHVWSENSRDKPLFG